MNITITPYRHGLWIGKEQDLVALVKITPPSAVPAAVSRNISFVIDRSGSMQGAALEMAKQGVVQALRKLSAGDRISVITFDEQVDVVLPSMPVENLEAMEAKIASITAGGFTDLFAGWQRGIKEVRCAAGYGLNRVILLTDGETNRGTTVPEEIAGAVKEALAGGTSTSVVGMGPHYNEDLMELISTNGDGNYYYARAAGELPQVFEDEINAVRSLAGQQVRLEFHSAQGLTLTDILNDYARKADVIELPNLRAGRSIEVMLRLGVPKVLSEDLDLFGLELRWVDRDGNLLKAAASLRLPVLAVTAVEELPVNQEVKDKSAVFETARLMRSAAVATEQGKDDQTTVYLAQARSLLGTVQDAQLSGAYTSDLGQLE